MRKFGDNELISRMRNIFESLSTTGFFGIVSATAINKVLVFLSGMVLVRVISKSDYGVYSYALNIINYFVLLSGLGTSSCVVQYCVEQNDDAKAERIYSILSTIGMAWDVVLAIAIIITSLLVDLPIAGAEELLVILSPYPILALMVDFQQQRLRSQFRNREYALATNVNTIAVVAMSLIGAIAASSIGLSIGRCFAMLLSVLIVFFSMRVPVYFRCERPSKRLLLDILKMALTVCLTNAVSQMLILVGTTLVGTLLADNESVATYSTATTIPFALSFIPSMVMIYATPFFVKHSTDRQWVMKGWLYCTCSIGVIAMIATTILIAISSWLVPFLFGAQYTSSVSSFNILMLAFAVSAPLRTVSGNILATHRKYGFNFFSGAVTLVSCFVASVIFINQFGVIGSALGYLISMILGSVINLIGLFVFAGKPVAHVEL